MTEATLPDGLEGLPPSAKLVALALQAGGPATQAALVERTRAAPRTVRFALARLDEAGYLEQRPCLQDARQDIYRFEP